MPDIQSNDFNSSDSFNDFIAGQKSIYEVSPRMAEYIKTMETYLLVREKQVSEKRSTEAELPA